MQPTVAPPLVEAVGLTLAAAGRTLVRALDWQARPAERWCVLGRNAAGKSTLLRALAGLPVPHREGTVRWLGRAQAEWSPADAAAVRAFAPQQPQDRFSMSVRRLLELAVCVPGEASPSSVLDALDAGALADRDLMQLSGGERQRVALAQSALQGAPMMLLDEPIAFQDPGHQRQVGRWLGAWSGRCIVFTAHDVNWAAAVATHVLALYGDGRWEAGPARQMLDAARLEVIYGCRWRQEGGAWLVD